MSGCDCQSDMYGGGSCRCRCCRDSEDLRDALAKVTAERDRLVGYACEAQAALTGAGFNACDGWVGMLHAALSALAKAREEVAEKEALIAAWNEIINAMGERCKAAERARDEALAALREVSDSFYEFGKPWDRIPGSIDRARRVLAPRGQTGNI